MKGEWGDICNRGACGNKPAYFYNRSTRKYYCQHDAVLINNVNRRGSVRLFQDERLCVFVSELDAEKRVIIESKLCGIKVVE